MGTTAVCALIRGGRVHLCHAGDSRAYLLHAGRLTQLTHDHSYVQELVDCGTITVQEAENHPQKNIITRALGVDLRMQPEYTSTVMLPGDLLLLCTDGLTNMVQAVQLQEILTQNDFYDVPDRLIEAANAGGGQDNITALLLEMESTEVKHG
jgi:protein phosphatase